MKGLCTLLSVVMTLWLAGCGSAADSPAATASPAADAGHEHDHPHHGPHDGDLMELGNDEYHAEIVDSEDGMVSVYILDSTARTTVPIEAQELTVNVVHEGQPEQFALAAAPDSGDAEGRSSRFVSGDTQLAKHLDEAGTEVKVTVTIGGKSYSGRITHDHGLDHGHAH